MQPRRPNTNRQGHDFPGEVKLAVWQKTAAAQGHNLGVTRMDVCGALINWADYGETTHHGNGWEIDHIMPVARGGGDELSNLQALQWQNNRDKGNSIGKNYCLVSARG